MPLVVLCIVVFCIAVAVVGAPLVPIQVAELGAPCPSALLLLGVVGSWGGGFGGGGGPSESDIAWVCCRKAAGCKSGNFVRGACALSGVRVVHKRVFVVLVAKAGRCSTVEPQTRW